MQFDFEEWRFSATDLKDNIRGRKSMLSDTNNPGPSGTRQLMKIAVLCAATMALAGCTQRQPTGNGNPLAPGPDQQVHLVWQGNDWLVGVGTANPVKPSDAHTKIPRYTGPTKITVDIVGNTSASFKKQGALSAWTTGSKLQPQSGINSTQILGPVLTDDGKLVFYDLNQGDAVTIFYSIHLDNSPKPDVDPIMDNGGSN
jgi:hypothetical protein